MILFVNHAYSEGLVQTQKYSAGVVRKIDRYQVNVSKQIKQFTGQDNPGLGSSMILKDVKDNGELEFFALTDRGLNFRVNIGGKNTAQLFINPKFQPFINIIKVSPKNGAVVDNVISLNAHGLPGTNNLANTEMAIGTNLRQIFTRNGVDSEALALDKYGNFWVAEEYGPAVLKVKKSGEIIERHDLSNGLPEIIKHRIANRGIEAIESKQDGTILFAMESVLDVDQKTKNNALFVRVMEFNPKTKHVKIFAYPYDYDYYDNISDVKISDFSYIDDQHILVVEQGPKNSIVQNQIKMMDIRGATDISGQKLANGKELEFAKSLEELSHINMIRKTHVVNMKNYGWEFEKLEGLAYINKNTIAIINDNDFGKIMELGELCANKHCEFEVDVDKGRIKRNGDKVKTTFKLKDSGQKTNLWVVYLSKSLLS